MISVSKIIFLSIHQNHRIVLRYLDLNCITCHVPDYIWIAKTKYTDANKYLDFTFSSDQKGEKDINCS